ncbi:MAG: AI-2E family transporter [Pseudomonadota bacterium]
MTGRARASPWQLVAATVLLLLLWQVRQPLMVFFGAVLVAAALHALAEPLARRARLSERAATAWVLAGLVALAALGLWLLGDPLSQQLQALRTELPRAWSALQRWLQQLPLGNRLLELVGEVRDGELPLAGIAGAATRVLHGLGAAVLTLLMGVYLAFDVRLYRDGLVRLAPPARREAVGEALDATGRALTRWLRGQGITMLVVGAAVSIGLTLLGMPMALALGLIAGLLEFVPYIGPIASGLLAVLVAFVQGPQQALYVALLFVALQQVENHLLVPLVQRWAVALPPVLALGGVLLFGALLGPAGLILGTPLIVVTMVLVQKLYVERMLEGRS